MPVFIEAIIIVFSVAFAAILVMFFVMKMHEHFSKKEEEYESTKDLKKQIVKLDNELRQLSLQIELERLDMRFKNKEEK